MRRLLMCGGALLTVTLCGAVPFAAAAELTPQRIYERAAPGVVLIIGYPERAEGGSAGTGSIIRADGLVLTNAHVVVEEKTGKPYPRLFVFLKPARVTGNPQTDLARKVKASVVAFNRALDMALVKMAAVPETVPVLNLSDPDLIRIGDRVVAIGHPEQGGLWTLTTGVVSAEFEDFNNTKEKNVFQTEVSLNRGNSGGPLLDTQGQIVGVNTSIARLAADGLPITSISFSLKSSVARKWLREQGVMVDYVAMPVAPPPPSAPAPNKPQEPPAPDKLQEPPAPSTVSPAPKAPVPDKPQGPPAPKVASPPPPKIHTDPRPYDMDQLITGFRRTERDMENLADEMRKRIHPQ